MCGIDPADAGLQGAPRRRCGQDERQSVTALRGIAERGVKPTEELVARASPSVFLGGSTVIGSRVLPYLPPMSSWCCARLLRL